MRVVLIDNYDSFTWNLVHLASRFTRDIEVVRNDARTARDVVEGGFDAILLSPGPRTPDDAGICLEVIEKGAGRVPIFGVCLGLQAIGQVFGAKVVRSPLPMHGKTSAIRHSGAGLFAGCPQDMVTTRYHSLVIDRDSLPADLVVDAHCEEGLVMAASHRTLPVKGVQFHPESILTEHGETVLGNFFEEARAYRNA